MNALRPASPPPLLRRDDLVAALLLASLLALAFLLTYNGEFDSVDELALYATTESLVQVGRLETPQLTFARWHNPVASIELGQPLLTAPLYWLGLQLPWASNIHAVLLLNVWVTAATGAMLYLVERAQGQRAVAALSVAAAYGLGTLAWPYARTLFREPLIACCWAAAALCLLGWTRRGGWGWLAAGLVAVMAAMPIKASAAFVVPAFVLAAALGAPPAKRRVAWLLAGCASLAALTAGLAAYAWRYGWPPPLAEYTYAYPWGDMLRRTFWLWLSPAKGLLFFSPVVLGAVLGWPVLWRRQHALTLFALLACAATFYAYGNHATWYGGLVWGPRFLLPLLPLLLLPLAVVLDEGPRLRRLIAGLLAVLSVGVQLPVVTAEWNAAVGQLDPAVRPDGPWHDLRAWWRSPAIYQARHWRPDWLDLLWWRRAGEGVYHHDLLLVGALLLLLAVASALLTWWLLRGAGRVGRGSWLPAALGLSLAAIGSGLVLWRGDRALRGYPGLEVDEARQIAALVRSAGSPYVVASVSNEFYTYYWLGLLKGRYVHHWFSPMMTDGFDGVLAAGLQADDLWLVIDHVHLQHDHAPEAAAHWLNAHAYPAWGTWVGGYELVHYLLPGEALTHQSSTCAWGGQLALASYAIEADALTRGRGLRLEFAFEALGPVREDYVWFVHAVGPGGARVPGRDGQPLYGAAPPTAWHIGEPMLDRRALLLPKDLAPGRYTLVAGFVDGTGARLPARCADGAQVDEIVLGTVEVLP